MLKQSILYGVLAILFTGCVVAPYNDHPNKHNNGRYDQDKRYDRDHKRPNWKQDKRYDRDHKRPNWQQDKHLDRKNERAHSPFRNHDRTLKR